MVNGREMGFFLSMFDDLAVTIHCLSLQPRQLPGASFLIEKAPSGHAIFCTIWSGFIKLLQAYFKGMGVCTIKFQLVVLSAQAFSNLSLQQC